MTRRILLVLLAFTAVVIAGAMVPLALISIEHDQNSFVQATEGMVRTDAAVAQARLDGSPDQPLLYLLNEVQQAGDGLLILQRNRVLNSAGQTQIEEIRLSEKGSMPVPNLKQLALQADEPSQVTTEAHQAAHPVTETTGSVVVAAIPVYERGKGPLVGTVILARSSTSLDQSIFNLWIIMGTIALLALLAAALLAFALARWVSRPLAGLDNAAMRLADGDLAIRAVVGSGPPELRRLAGTFNTMAGRLEALVHGNRAVIADVSHQLRTPLAALRLRLDLLAADTAQSDPDTAHELAGALEELARLSRLVDGLLAVARAENVVPVPAAVDMAEVAAERVAAWHPVANDRGIVLETAERGKAGGRGTSSGPALAWIGEGHLEQILDNLIANALEALSAGNHVLVTTAATASGTQITVRDDGPGMNAEDRERAFLRFSTSNPNGTGLGLAIVHRLATSNGGTASLAQTPGGGLTVTLDFPGVLAPNSNGPASNGPASNGPASNGPASNGPASNGGAYDGSSAGHNLLSM